MLKKSVLLVEDDEQTSMIIKFVLNHAGYLVKVATNGYDAMDIVDRQHFDLVILDINMPMMNGFEFLERVNKRDEVKDIPILTLTVRNDQKSILKAKSLGVDQYMVKPPEKETLLRKVRALTDKETSYSHVKLGSNSDLSDTKMKFSGYVVSVSEIGLLMHSPIPLEPKAVVNHLEIELFKRLEIHSPKLLVHECKYNKINKCFEIFFAFSEMAEPHIKRLRQWVVDEAEKEKQKEKEKHSQGAA